MNHCAHKAGKLRALHALGLTKLSSPIDLDQVKHLSSQSIWNKLERMVTPDLTGDNDETYRKAFTVADAEQKALKKRFGVDPVWFGSIPMGINLPNDVDIDIFTPIADKQLFSKVLSDLKSDPKYYYSPANTPGTNFQVFKRQAQGDDDYPVDIAVAFGAQANDYAKRLREGIAATRDLPDDVRQGIIAKKHLHRQSPFSNKGSYLKWKSELSKATGTYISRPELEKLSAVVDLSKPDELDKFRKFTQYKDMYGHRTHNVDAVLKAQGLMSALESLKRNKLKSYEAGSSLGTHKDIEYNNLSASQLKEIEEAMLTEKPNASVFKNVAEATGKDVDVVKADFIRQNFNKVKSFLQKQENPESFRKKHFSVDKLGPNIFLTRGGVLDTDAYGDTAVLLRSRAAKKSPFMNLVTDEYIVPPKAVLEPRRLRIGSGYVLAPRAKLKSLNAEHPQVKFVASEDIPDDIKNTLYKPVHSLKETWQRWVPNALGGDLDVWQTR